MAKAEVDLDVPAALSTLKECPPSLLLLSPDEIRRSRNLCYLRETFSTRDTTKSIDCRTCRDEHLLTLRTQSATLSLFASSTMYILQHAEELSATQTKILLDILNDPSPCARFVICAGKLAANSTLLKFFKSKSLLIELPILERAGLQRWAAHECGRAGITDFAKDALDTILMLADNSPDRIHRMLSHLALYLGDEKLTTAAVFELFIDNPDPNEFGLIDALASRNTPLVETLIHDLIHSGKSPFLLLSLLMRTFNNYLLIILSLKKGKSPGEIKAGLKMTDWVFNKNLAAAKKYSVPALKKAILFLVRADSKLKNRSLGPDMVLSEIAVHLTP